MSEPCLCNQCNLNTISCICGTFECPDVPDEGKGYPYRQKISCEAPTLPTAPCDEDTYITIFTPENPLYAFYIISALYDEDCELVTDQNGASITLIIL